MHCVRLNATPRFTLPHSLADTTAISRSCFTVVIVDNAWQYSASEVPLRSIPPLSRHPLTAVGGQPPRRDTALHTQFSPLGKLRTEVGCGLRAREACPQFPPREPQCRIRWQLITILQSTFANKPYSMALQGTSASEVEGKGAHLQRRTPSQGLQTAIAIKGELQYRPTDRHVRQA